AGTGFSAAVAIPAPVGGVLPPTTVYVRYNPGAGATQHSGASVQFVNGANAVVNLAGTVVTQPLIQVSTSSLTFVTGPSGPSNAQPYTVWGLSMAGPIEIQVGPQFEVSLSQGSGFTHTVTTAPPTGGS